MKLETFLLDSWLHEHDDRPLEFNLGASTGPQWTLGEVLDLEAGSRDRLFATNVVYAPSAGTMALRRAIAAMHGVDADQVVVVAGGSEALLHVFFLAAAPGANVIVPFPGFPPYWAIPKALGVEVRFYHLRRDAAYRVDPDEVAGLADKNTKLLLVNSPHNPTGATLDTGELRWLHDFAVDRGAQFVSDEVFHPIYHAQPGPSASTLPKATIIGDLSKALALAGLRLGWIVERDDERRAQYLNARQYFTISNTIIGEHVADIAVRHRDTIWARTTDVASANLRHVDALLARHTRMLDWVRPKGGMTSFPRFVSGSDARPFCTAAARAGVLLVPGDCFGTPDHFRLGFGVGREWFPAAMERLDKLLAA